MDLFDPTQLALTTAMRGATARQTALANNLANVDTPGYVRKDVDFHGALRAAMGTEPGPGADFAAGADFGPGTDFAAGTVAAPTAGAPSLSFSAQDDAAAPMRVDGNTVDVDSESAKLAQNGLEYQSLAQVAAARIDILQSAMGVK